MEFEGDPKFTLEGLTIENGQPLMDTGLENAVTLSLFTEGEWWGNLLGVTSEQFTSKLKSILDTGKLTNKIRLDADAAIKAALAWMKTDNLVQEINVSSSINNGYQCIIELTQPNNTIKYIYKPNWEVLG